MPGSEAADDPIGEVALALRGATGEDDHVAAYAALEHRVGARVVVRQMPSSRLAAQLLDGVGEDAALVS